MKHCRHCGQLILMRCGVRLSPRLADIFDMIERAGDHGVTVERLVVAFYAGKPEAAARDAIKSNIWQLNDRLVETTTRVAMQPPRYGAYRLDQTIFPLRRPRRDRSEAAP